MLSIVIVSFNARDHLARCLNTLYAFLPPSAHPGALEGRAPSSEESFEIVVVDNASPDASADLVESRFPAVRLIRNPTNTGFASAANTGARVTHGDAILFLNPDSELQDDAFSAPAGYLREHPDIGALGVQVRNPDGTLQLSVRRFPGVEAALFNRYSLLTRLLPRNPFSQRYLMTDWDHASISDVDWLSGACLMTTRATLDRVGYFDDAYFWGFEDVDFCQRVHRAGLRVVYYPLTSVVHAIGASARTVPSRALIARHKGMWRYYKRWLGRNPVFDALVFGGIWARCGAILTSAWLRKKLAGATRSP